MTQFLNNSRFKRLFWYSSIVVCSLYILWSFRNRFRVKVLTRNQTIEKIEIGLPQNGFIPVLNCFMSNTRKESVVYTNNERNQLRIFDYYEKNMSFCEVFHSNFQDIIIKSVSSVDFNDHNINDILLMHSKNGQEPYDLSILRNNNGLFENILQPLGIKSLSIPLILYENNTRVLLIQDPQTQKYVKLGKNGSLITNINDSYITFVTGQIEKKQNENKILALHESGSFISIWDQGFLSETRLLTPQYSKDIYLADIDDDSNLDLLIAVSPPNSPSFICIYFNNGTGYNSDPQCSRIDTSLKYVVGEGFSNESAITSVDFFGYGRNDIILNSYLNGSETIIVLSNHKCIGCGFREVILSKHSYIEGNGGIFDPFNNGSISIISNKGGVYTYWKSELDYYMSIRSLSQNIDELNQIQAKNSFSRTRYGSTIRVIYTDRSGLKHEKVCAIQQKNAPHTSSCIFNFGDSIHYIDSIGLFGSIQDEWNWILPNSEVYLYENHQIIVYSKYRVQPYYVVFWTTVLLCILGLSVLYLSIREEEEDKNEAESMLPLF